MARINREDTLFGDTMNTIKRIEEIIGRPIEFEQVTYEGVTGYLPVYLNYNSPDFVPSVFSPSRDEAAINFLEYLKGKGEHHVRNINQSGSEDHQQDQGPAPHNED